MAATEHRYDDSVATSIDVKLPLAQAFALFTEQYGRWYQDGPHSWRDADRAKGVRLEPGLGGRLFEYYDEAATDCYVFGEITQWHPPTDFSLRWQHHPDDHVTQVRFSFDALAFGTRITITHAGWRKLPKAVAELGMNNVLHGWPTLLRWFQEFSNTTRAGS